MRREGHRCQFVFAYSVLSVMSVQSFCGKDEGFCGEDKGFCGKDEGFCGEDKGFCGEDEGFCGEDEGFLAKTKDFLLFLRLCQKSFIFATLFAMFTLHTNEGSTYTEHVQTY